MKTKDKELLKAYTQGYKDGVNAKPKQDKLVEALEEARSMIQSRCSDTKEKTDVLRMIDQALTEAKEEGGGDEG